MEMRPVGLIVMGIILSGCRPLDSPAAELLTVCHGRQSSHFAGCGPGVFATLEAFNPGVVQSDCD